MCRRPGRPPRVPGPAHPVEPDPEEPRQRRLLRGRDLEHHDAAARPRHARHLPQPAVEVREVARTEPHGHRVELAVAVGQLERVALHPLHARGLAARQLEHRLGEVEPCHLRAPARQLDRQVAGAGGHVQRPRPGADARQVGSPLAPAVMHAGRHDRVHQVVHARDAVEHRADLRVREDAWGARVHEANPRSSARRRTRPACRTARVGPAAAACTPASARSGSPASARSRPGPTGRPLR